MTLWYVVIEGSPHPKLNGYQRPIPGGACGAKGLSTFSQPPASGGLPRHTLPKLPNFVLLRNFRVGDLPEVSGLKLSLFGETFSNVVKLSTCVRRVWRCFPKWRPWADCERVVHGLCGLSCFYQTVDDYNQGRAIRKNTHTGRPQYAV